MAIEIELKLRIAPERLQQLKRHPLLGKLAAGRPVTRKLYSVYYDTPDLALHRQRMALRLRRSGRQWLQTLKGGGGVQAGLHSRNEWETPVSGEALDFTALEAAGAAALPHALRRKLRPLFVTDFSRTSRMLAFEGAEIELCMDSGEIRSGRKRRPISEIELELKSGEPRQLFLLAQTLLDIVPMEIENVSKAEYGYALYAGIKPAPLKSHAPVLGKCEDVSCLLRAMTESCLMHLQANVPGAVEGRDEEFLHQVRVALRRLRVALAMAGRYRSDTGLTALRTEVSELCVLLGSLRERDVFVSQTLRSLSRHSALLRAAKKQRNRHQAAMSEKLCSSEYQHLILRLGAWLHGDYWQEALPLPPAFFAAGVLERRRRKAGKLGKRIARADEERLHALRIACKKLRYSAEMFASLFDGDGQRVVDYRNALSSLQDTLGALNDITTAHRLLDELELDGRYPESPVIRKKLHRDHARLLAKLGVEWKKFAGKRAFWRVPPETGKG